MDSRTGLALAGLLALTGCTSTGEQATGEETEESTKETEQATSEVTESEATTETTSTDPDEAILDRCRGRHDNMWRSGETLEEQVVGSNGYDPNDEPGNGMKFVALCKMRAEPERDWGGGWTPVDGAYDIQPTNEIVARVQSKAQPTSMDQSRPFSTEAEAEAAWEAAGRPSAGKMPSWLAEQVCPRHPENPDCP